MKTYVTFGQTHAHSVNGKTFDKDCVAVIECDSERDGRERAFFYFEKEFCFDYFEDDFRMSDLDKYYPRGLIPVNFNVDNPGESS